MGRLVGGERGVELVHELAEGLGPYVNRDFARVFQPRVVTPLLAASMGAGAFVVAWL